MLVYYCIIILEVVLISLQFVNIKGIDTGNICYKYNEIELDNYETHYINNKEFKLENGNASLKLYYDNKNNSLYLRNDAINYGIYFENELNNIMNYEVLDNENNVIDSWKSTEKTHKIEGLTIGKEYTLKEEIAPEGYVVATSIKFTIKDTNEIQKVNNINTIIFFIQHPPSLHTIINQIRFNNK